MGALENCELGAFGALADFNRAHGSTCRSSKHHFCACPRSDCLAEQIVGIQNHGSFRSYCFGQRPFFSGDCFARTQELDVRYADICNNRRVGGGDLRQLCDFAGMVHPDFPNGHFILGSGFQNGAWQPNVIVEIAFGFRDAKFSREDRRGEILRARLAVASGDREYLQPKQTPVICSNLLIRLQRIDRSDERKIFWNMPVPVAIHERTRGARFGGGFDEIVCIEIFPVQRHEQFTGFNRARIGADFIDHHSSVTGFK